MSTQTPYGQRKQWLVYMGIIAFSILFFLPFLGSVHLFDSDEVKYAESAREMIVTGDYLTVQIDFEPFPEKPPLFFWLQVISMKLFGINEFAARFPNFICGIVSLLILYSLGKRINGERFGIFWILSYGAAILPFFFFKSGIIDPWFNLFIFIGIAFFVFYMDPERKRNRLLNLVLSALFMGLATLTKGPLAVIIFLTCFLVFLWLKRGKIPGTTGQLFLFAGVLVAVGGSWYLVQLIAGNGQVLREFMQFQVNELVKGRSGQEGFFGYHLVILLLGVFPASVISLKSFTKKAEDTELQRLFKQWMYILFWVVILLFSIIPNKLLHYSSLAYIPISYLAAWVWEKWVERKIEIGNWQVILLLLIALFYAFLSIFFPLLTDHNDWLLSREFKFLNLFAREALLRDVHWSGYEWLIGVFLLLGVGTAAVQILRRYTSGMLVLHLVALLFVTASIYMFTGRIEGYRQRVAIKFYKGLSGQEVYVNTLGYTSYSHLYYFDKQPPDGDDRIERIMTGTLDRDAYFVMRVDKKERYLERYPDLEVLHEKDGYVFTVLRAGPSARSGTD